jgi:Ice-binding-like
MRGFESFFRSRVWLVALLLAAIVSGCGGGTGADGGSAQTTAPGAGTGVGGAGQGPAPVNLRTAGGFAILAETAITNIAASQVTGDVGLSPASGAGIGLSCDEVAGVIYTRDTTGPSCRVTDRTRLTNAVADGVTAFVDARARVPDYIDLGAGNIGGRNLGPATYKWNTAVVIPANLTLTGGPNDVWIFQIWQLDTSVSLSVGAGVQIILAGGALPQNVYWEINRAELGTTSKFEGVILADNEIVMNAGASINGRVLAGSAANLDQNTVTQPGP